MTTITHDAPNTATSPIGTAAEAVAAAASPEHVLLARFDYRQAPMWLVAHLLAAVAFALSLWSPDSANLLFSWLVFMTLTATVHWRLYAQYTERLGAPGVVSAWELACAFMTAVYGLGWSVIACLLLSGFPATSWRIGGAVALVAGITSPMLAANRRALAAYLAALTLPLVILALFPQDHRVYAAIGLVAAVGAVAWLSVRQLYRNLAESDGLIGDFLRHGSALTRENRDLAERIERLQQDVVTGTHALVRAQHERERAQTSLHALGEGVITTDVNGLIDYMNPVAEVLTGWNFSSVRNRPLMSVFNLVNRTTGERPMISAEQCLLVERTVVGDEDSTLVRRDGVEYEIEHVGSPIRDRRGRLTGSALIFRDVTEKRSLQSQLNWAASHDALTGLINRAEFEKRLAKLIDDTTTAGRTHVLCFLDLDRFKAINDSHGHAAGDEVLKAMADLLRNRIRGADTLARLGGDEFAVLLYSCPMHKARMIAEGLRRLIDTFSIDWQDRTLKIAASIGLVEINEESRSLADVVAAADFACYAAKNEGRNAVRVFRADGEATSRRHGEIHWLRTLERALAKDDFEIRYQPIQPLDDADPRLHCELTLYLRDEHGEVHGPEAFHAAAERYRLCPDIDLRMVRHAVEALRQRHPVLVNMHTISIGVSGQSICDDTFVRDVTAMVGDPDLPASRLCFEIAEADLIPNLERARRFIAALRDRGCRFGLDNFGVGAGSWQCLKKLDVDFMKIDAGLLSDVDLNSADFEIVLSLARVAQTMEIHTIAECDAGGFNRELLQRIGIDYVQVKAGEPPRPLSAGVH